MREISEVSKSLIGRAVNGDVAAMTALLEQFRSQLGRMVRCRMDSRLTQRFDPSDVVQEALLAASVKLPDYLRSQAVPFYPWLRRLAWEHLVALQRQHLGAEQRSVIREEPVEEQLSEDSLDQLAQSIAPKSAGPLTKLVRQERLQQVRQALARLEEPQREVLVLRYLEGLQLSEVAEVMGITLAATKMRHLRAVHHLRELLPSW